jgi:hypothetical protein
VAYVLLSIGRSADNLDCVVVEISDSGPAWRWTTFDAQMKPWVRTGKAIFGGQTQPRIGVKSTFVKIGNGRWGGGSKDNKRALGRLKGVGSFANLQDGQSFDTTASRESVSDGTDRR